MENTTSKKMKDESTMAGECPSCTSMKSYCTFHKVAQCIFRGLVILALAKFVFSGLGGYHMRGGMEYRMDRGSMMMSGSLRDYKEGERGFFKKRLDRDDETLGTGLIATESTQ